MSTRWKPGITKVPLPETLRIFPAPETIISLSGGHFRQQDSKTQTTITTIRAIGRSCPMDSKPLSILSPVSLGRLGAPL